MATEVESKLELSYDDFTAIMNAGRVVKCEDQLNVYYDRDAVLATAAITLRIRFTRKDTPVLTLKVPKSFQDGKRIASEFEYAFHGRSGPIVLRVHPDLPADIARVLGQMEIQSVTRMGWMRTARFSVELAKDVCVDLDQVWLPGGTQFFEAEIETSENAVHEVAVAAVKRLAQSARPSIYSKFERFCAAARRHLVTESGPCFSH